MPSTTSAKEHEAVPYKVEIAPAARRPLDPIHGPDLDRLTTAVEALPRTPVPVAAASWSRGRTSAAFASVTIG